MTKTMDGTAQGTTPRLPPHREISLVDLHPLTAIQQNNFTPQPALSRATITLTVCVTHCPSTTSRQHYFHRTAPLYMERRIYFRSPLRGWQLATPPYTGKGSALPEQLTNHQSAERASHGGWCRKMVPGQSFLEFTVLPCGSGCVRSYNDKG